MLNQKLETAYLKLINSEYNGSEIWKQFNSKATETPLTASIAFKGEQFDTCNFKLMVVGRAMNGWETDFSQCYTAEDVKNTVLNQKFSFSDVINTEGFPREGKRPYRYITSKFWKLIKYVLEEYGEANNEWYDKTKNMNWNEKIVWSNLYKVSPRYENNPDDLLIKKTLEANIEILKTEISEYSPDLILFVTDRWFLEPFPQMPSFSEAFKIRFDGNYSYDSVVGHGVYANSKIVVCKRPDIRGYTDEKVKTMSNEIKSEFDKI